MQGYAHASPVNNVNMEDRFQGVAPTSSWQDLLAGIRQAFSTDKVDIDDVKLLLSSYKSKREDWEPYAKFDAHRYIALTFVLNSSCVKRAFQIHTESCRRG